MKQKEMLAIVTALASIAFALTIQQQNVVAFSDNNQFVRSHHDHTNCGAEIGSCVSNEGTVTNDESTHYNENTNTHRDDPFKPHLVEKPDNGK